VPATADDFVHGVKVSRPTLGIGPGFHGYEAGRGAAPISPVA
jgi:hypothetical protein